jgi:uncharacterized protein (TIGR03435 family)
MRAATMLAFAGILAYGQEKPKLEFEVASIKPSAIPPGGRGMNVGSRGGPGTADPAQVVYSNMTLKLLIMSAYNVKNYQVTAPDWTDEGQRFNIAAKVPAGASKEDARVMLMNLLADRFQMKAHLEMKEMQAFALVVTKGGVKMKLSEETPDPNGAPNALPPLSGPPKFDKNGFPIVSGTGMILETQNGRARLAAKQASIGQICNFLGIQFARPVIDQTGLTGKYDYNLEFAPENMRPTDAGASPTSSDPAPTLLVAIQDQLGLKLEAKKLPVDIVIVDHIEKSPTEN